MPRAEEFMKGVKDKYKVLMIAPTCFYWQVQLYRVVSLHPRIDLKVYFCCDEALHVNNVLREYKVGLDWGVGEEILEGYENHFLRNFSPWPSYTNWPFGLINPGIWSEISKERPDAVVVSAWTNITWWVAILASLKFKIPFFYHTDATGIAEHKKSRWKLWPKKFILGKLIFPLADGFLNAGNANKSLFSFYGVPDAKLVSFAYSWGYESLIKSADELAPMRSRLRSELGIPEDSNVFLFCGRLIPEKNIFDLLEAYKNVTDDKKVLMIVGDGHLRRQLTEYVLEHQIDEVHFCGFQNRNEISKYYAISDALVLPSSSETWGIVVSEALCFGLPVIVSDQVGSGYDLVDNGRNGFMFPVGDVNALGNALDRISRLSESEKLDFRMHSMSLIASWIRKDVAGNLVQYLDKIYSDNN